ncbi:MAG: PRD domain-containing protein [Lachnospiraceae bacterium]|nr:PRD domain-containing protein [Lachnospiraceae bacterium]
MQQSGENQIRIKKVINNNIVEALDKSGNEMILTGRGIGFKRTVGQFIDMTKVEKTYHMEEKNYQRKLRELVRQIPLAHLDATQEMIDHIQQVLGKPVNESLLISLADHISFAIRRLEEGMNFDNPLRSSIMCYYPMEYNLGLDCLMIIERRLHARLPESEASFIAMHILNAELNSDMSSTNSMVRLMNGCIDEAEAYYGKTFDRDSLDFSRFAVHLRYLIQRLYQGKCLKKDSDNNSFLEMIQSSCRREYGCAEHIADYIRKTYGSGISEEEKIYLTIHLKRMEAGDV